MDDGTCDHILVKTKELVKEAQARMEEASAELRFRSHQGSDSAFEKNASRLQQGDLKLVDTDCDVFGIVQGDRETSLVVLHFRDGLLMASRNFFLQTQYRRVCVRQSRYDANAVLYAGGAGDPKDSHRG